MGNRGNQFTVWSAASGPAWESAPTASGLPRKSFGWGDHLFEDKDGDKDGKSPIGKASIQADADGKDAEGYLHIKGEGHIFLDNGRLTFDGTTKLSGTFEISGGTRDFAGTQGGSVELSTVNPKRWKVRL